MTANGVKRRQSLTTSECERLVSEHAPLIRAIAFSIKRNLPDSVDVNDLIQDGYIALLGALLKTTTEAVRLQSRLYMSQRLRGAMMDGLRLNDPGSRTLRNTMRRAAREIQALGHKLGRPPLEGEVATSIRMSIAEYQRLLQDANKFALLSIEDLNNEDAAGDFIERCASTNADPAAALERRELQRDLLLAISSLTEREERVMSLLYVHDMTLRRVGEDLGLSEGRISQIHSTIVARLRAAVLGEGRAVLAPRRRAA